MEGDIYQEKDDIISHKSGCVFFSNVFATFTDVCMYSRAATYDSFQSLQRECFI